MHTRTKGRSIRGFSMTEMLAVLAVLAVLMAVAMPNVISLKKSLDMAQLDEQAKQIYLAAQSSATALQTNGRLDNFEGVLGSDGNSSKLTNWPSDYPADDSGTERANQKIPDGYSVYYANKDSSAVSTYLITSDSNLYTTSSDTFKGNYIIEMSPSTGEIYSVFYADHSFTYDDVLALASRNRSDREASKLGYYHGGELSKATQQEAGPTFSDIKFELINSEELYVKFSSTDFAKAYTQNLSDALEVSVTVTGQSRQWGKTASKTLTYSGKDLGISNSTDEVDVILDSMRDGKSFYDLFGDSGIYPGVNINVTATITCKDVNKSSAFTTNSLYGSYDNGAVTISCLRHLNNLRTNKLGSYVSGMNPTSSVQITQNIDFDGTHWAVDSVSALSRTAEGKAYNPLSSFSPLSGNEVFANSGGTGSIEGNNHNLSNFVISDGFASVGGTGVFGSYRGALSNLFMIDPTVTGTENTGTLVGILDNGASSITNCGVYLTGSYTTHTVTGTSNVGGLVGKLSGNTITNSFAAINVKGSDNVGGLLGYATGGQGFDHCYSSGDVAASGSRAGGLVGYCGRGASNCYTTSNVFCNTYAAAFAGFLSSDTSTNDVAYGRVAKTDGTTDDAFVASTKGFCGTDSALNWPDSSLVFLQMHDYNDKVTDSRFTATSYSDLTKNTYSVANSHPYADYLKNTAFPFANTCGLGTHYGNWPTKAHVIWQRDDNVVLQEYDTYYGATPTYTGSTVFDYTSTENRDVVMPDGKTNPQDCTIYHYATGTWSPAVAAVTANVTYTMGYSAYPAPSQLLQGGLKYRNDSSMKSLWEYIGNNSSSNYTKKDIQVDSEASYDTSGTLANIATAINDQLQHQGYDTSNFSWRIYTRKNTYAVYNDAKTGENTSGNYENNFLIFIGDKIPSNPTTEQQSATYSVIKFDYGRLMHGMDAYQRGTIKLSKRTSNNVTYWIYDSSNYAATSDWYAPAS